jgi:hypothetical protein
VDLSAPGAWVIAMSYAHGNSACWAEVLFMGVGYLLGGSGGVLIAFFIAPR